MKKKNTLKKTVALAILAAVLSANLASCVSTKDPKPDTSTVYVDTSEKQTLPINPSDKPSEVTFESISKTVYVTRKSTLDPVDTTGEKVTVEAPTKLTCTAQSTNWYKVLYNGISYYIARARTTDDDIDAVTFASCSKTMYINTDILNVRKYPSAEDFSTVLCTVEQNASVSVVAESSSKGWSKISFKDKDGKDTYGYVKTKFLSTSSTSQSDWEKNFTAFDSPKTVYVIAESLLSLREKPFLPDEDGEGGGTIVGGKGVARGTELTAVAEGTVNDVVWYKVKYQPSPADPVVTCYGVKKYLSDTKPADASDPDTLIKQYSFTKFDTEFEVYAAVAKSLHIRSMPSADGSLVDTVENTVKMTAVAYGKSSAGTLWCLLRLSSGKYGFANYENLSLLSGNKKSPIPLSLESIIATYSLTAVTESKTNNNYEVKLYSTPTSTGSDSVIQTKAKGTTFEVVAKGTVGDNNWYLVKVESAYYFALQSAFN